MNDTVREYTSYWKVLIPYMRYMRSSHTVEPVKVTWGDDPQQYFLDFRAPSRSRITEGSKLVIYLHGGGWSSNSPTLHDFVGQKIASLGYDCIMAGYRKSPKWRFDAIIEDVFEGYVKIREYLENNGRSYEKIIISGSSAGAHLGALLCFDEEKKASYRIAENEFAGLLLMAGPVDFSYPQTGTLNKLLTRLFNTKDRNIWKTGEPIRKMTALPGLKVRIIQSRHDGLVGFEQARSLHEKAMSLGMSSTFYEVKDPWDTHSLYCVGVFLLETSQSETLRTVVEMIEGI